MSCKGLPGRLPVAKWLLHKSCFGPGIDWRLFIGRCHQRFFKVNEVDVQDAECHKVASVHQISHFWKVGLGKLTRVFQDPLAASVQVSECPTTAVECFQK